MIIKADLKYKQTDFSLPRCAIEKVVKLTPTEYAEFVSNSLGYYDFLREFNAEKHGHQPESITMNVVAANSEIDDVSLERLKGECVKEVKRLNGNFTFKDANDWQKG